MKLRQSPHGKKVYTVRPSYNAGYWILKYMLTGELNQSIETLVHYLPDCRPKLDAVLKDWHHPCETVPSCFPAFQGHR